MRWIRWGLIGAGIISSKSLEAGLIYGVAETGSIGRGYFIGSRGVSKGTFASWGGFYGGPGVGSCYPPYPEDNVVLTNNASNTVVGAFAGYGKGLFITNADSAEEIEGDGQVFSFNLGLGPKISFQFSLGDNGTWVFSITAGPGIGASGSGYRNRARARTDKIWDWK